MPEVGCCLVIRPKLSQRHLSAGASQQSSLSGSFAYTSVGAAGTLSRTHAGLMSAADKPESRLTEKRLHRGIYT